MYVGMYAYICARKSLLVMFRQNKDINLFGIGVGAVCVGIVVDGGDIVVVLLLSLVFICFFVCLFVC